MRKVFSVLFFLFVCVNICNAKDKLELSKIKFTAGRGPIVSGFFGTAEFDSDNNFLSTNFSTSAMFTNFHWKFFGNKLFIGGSIGYFFNVPWIGPQILSQPVKYIQTLSWLTFSAGHPDKDNGTGKFSIVNWERMNTTNSITLTTADLLGNYFIAFNYTLVNWQDSKPKHLTGGIAGVNFGENNIYNWCNTFSFDHLAQEWIFQTSVSWRLF